MIQNSYAAIQEKFLRWTETQPEIRAVIVVGSRARLDHPADRWSDLDLVVYTVNSQKYFGEALWLHDFGEVWAQAIDHTPRGDAEWFIFYAGGFKVDVLFVNIASLTGTILSDWVKHPDFSEVFSRGVQTLVDKTGSLGHLPHFTIQPSTRLPDQAELAELADRFMLTAVRTARLLYRNDLWRGRQAAEHDLKPLLLRMLEWHALSIFGPEHDIWYDGRFITEWADPQAVKRLPACFSGFDPDQSLSALQNTVRLFADLGGDVAKNLDLSFPDTSFQQVAAWLFEKPNLTG